MFRLSLRRSGESERPRGALWVAFFQPNKQEKRPKRGEKTHSWDRNPGPVAPKQRSMHGKRGRGAARLTDLIALAFTGHLLPQPLAAR